MHFWKLIIPAGFLFANLQNTTNYATKWCHSSSWCICNNSTCRTSNCLSAMRYYWLFPWKMWKRYITLEKNLKIRSMEIVWTFIHRSRFYFHMEEDFIFIFHNNWIYFHTSIGQRQLQRYMDVFCCSAIIS